ncbi:MAG TPA: hypothetical protein DGM69_01115 [Chloroflexi bacterium]|mgnify:CR=1 FL=1|nr:hypothetical protein [Chloroflexota bacterium]
MKNNNSKSNKLMITLLLIACVVLVGCNRSATDGILPDDLNTEEVVTNENNDVTNSDESNQDMQALLDDDVTALADGNEQLDETIDTTENSNNDEPLVEETTDQSEESATTETEVTDETVSEIVDTMPASGPITYTVQSGDWVYKIARMHNITAMALLSANPVIGTDQQVYPGQELIIPAQGSTSETSSEETTTPIENNTVENNTEDNNADSIMAPANALTPDTYEVQAGETMFSISQKLGVSIDSLASENNISEPFMIFVGQQLNIPSE